MNHDIYLRLNGETLEWSDTQDGSYAAVGPSSPSTPVNGTDTVTFHGGDGIQKIMKIDDGKNGSPKLIKAKRGEDSNTVVATIKDTTVRGEIDQYSIKVKPEGGGQPITVDPDMHGEGNP
ncbi:hypothetical protein [Ekhidna sp.]|uniref:hypothetical protein n=1 Tax=Ekhidna sp. TaxID=2608089 RepID=UPI00329A3ED6